LDGRFDRPAVLLRKNLSVAEAPGTAFGELDKKGDLGGKAIPREGIRLWSELGKGSIALGKGGAQAMQFLEFGFIVLLEAKEGGRGTGRDSRLEGWPARRGKGASA
jgi:hypothetical protein